MNRVSVCQVGFSSGFTSDFSTSSNFLVLQLASLNILKYFCCSSVGRCILDVAVFKTESSKARFKDVSDFGLETDSDFE